MGLSKKKKKKNCEEKRSLSFGSQRGDLIEGRRRAGEEVGQRMQKDGGWGGRLQHTCILSIMANRSVVWGRELTQCLKKRTRGFDSSPLPPLILRRCSTGMPPARCKKPRGEIRASAV